MSSDRVMVENLEVMYSAANYRRWMYHRISPYIGQRILEVGAGIGNFTSMILDRDLVVATDKYQACVDYLAARHGDRLKVPPLRLNLSEPDGLPVDFEFDTVVCLNVLEHVEGDHDALVYMRTKLAPGGRLIVLVPAFQFLYGPIDRAIEHYRRYTRDELVTKMERAGFRVEQSCYMNAIGIVGWFIINRVLKMEGESEIQVSWADRYVAPWAERLERVLPPPFGLSVIAVGRVD